MSLYQGRTTRLQSLRWIFFSKRESLPCERGWNLVALARLCGSVAAISAWEAKMTKGMVVWLARVVCSVAGARAQMGQTAPKVPAGTIIEPSKSFDALLKIYEGEM